jgi:hypothetical protein
MEEREASCNCGQLRVTVTGDPLVVTVCHCLACQRRTGSAFGLNARFARENLRVDGEFKQYVRVSDEGEERLYRFCPECGATVFYGFGEEILAVPVGAFADPAFPPPNREIYEHRKHPWVQTG